MRVAAKSIYHAQTVTESDYAYYKKEEAFSVESGYG